MIVEVMLKPEIHDPQGEAIASACHRLGFVCDVAHATEEVVRRHRGPLW